MYIAVTSIIVPAVKLFYLKQYNLLYTHYQRTIFFISDLENEKKKGVKIDKTNYIKLKHEGERRVIKKK